VDVSIACISRVWRRRVIGELIMGTVLVRKAAAGANDVRPAAPTTANNAKQAMNTSL
jgi:hypothetical protein